MACLLCLAEQSDEKNLIKIFTEKGEALNIKGIISKYFWIELKDVESCQCVCQQCWKCVLEFHEFYLSIEKAHQIFQQKCEEIVEKVDSIEESLNLSSYAATKCKSLREANVDQCTHTNQPNTRKKRGRPKALKPVDVLEEVPIETDSIMAGPEDVATLENLDIFSDTFQLKEEESDDDCQKDMLIMDSDFVTTKRCCRPPKNGKKQSKSKKKFRDQKSEQLSSDILVKTVLNIDDIKDEDFDTQLEAAINESIDSNEQYCADDIEESSKNKYAKHRSLTLEFDKFIAEHFNLICCLCQLTLEDFSELKTHFRVEHKISGYVACCGKKFLKRGLLVDHIRIHQNPEYFKCAECGKILADRRCLSGHMKNHEIKGAPKAFTCEICSKNFHSQIVLLRHVQIHMPEKLRKFECPQCLKKFASKYLMNQHHKNVHLNTYSKICDICGKKIVGREALERHHALHDAVPPPPIQCNLCGLILTTKYGLARHMKSMHNADNAIPQVCPICSKVSPNLYAQKRHIYYMHNIERRHSCPMCEKKFKRKKDLTEHMTTHTGDVLYTCPYCPKTFNSDANMYAHRKRVHRKEWEQKMREKFPLADIKERISSPTLETESKAAF